MKWLTRRPVPLNWLSTHFKCYMNLFQHDFPLYDWMYHPIIAIIYSFSERFFEKMLLCSERPESRTFEHSLRVMSIVFKTFFEYIFDVFIISSTSVHTQQNYLFTHYSHNDSIYIVSIDNADNIDNVDIDNVDIYHPLCFIYKHGYQKPQSFLRGFRYLRKSPSLGPVICLLFSRRHRASLPAREQSADFGWSAAKCHRTAKHLRRESYQLNIISPA